MNVFLLSPGRTATTTLAHAFSYVDGYTSSHESRTKYLSDDRVDYPSNHIECDNRLSWFLPRLSKKYAASGVLVSVLRDKNLIAKSYDQRWENINIMKAYSQGILRRDLSDNNFSVCVDYVCNIYEQINYFSKDWENFVEIDLKCPEKGVEKLLKIMGKESDFEKVISFLATHSLNQNDSGIIAKLKITYINLRVLLKDLFA